MKIPDIHIYAFAVGKHGGPYALKRKIQQYEEKKKKQEEVNRPISPFLSQLSLLMFLTNKRGGRKPLRVLECLRVFTSYSHNGQAV